MTPFKVTYDLVADAAYIYLAGETPPGGAAHTVTTKEGVNIDFDKEGRVIGIELLGGHLLHPKTLKAAKNKEEKWGCFCDLFACKPGTEPDGCVIDIDRRQDCIYAQKHSRKEECGEWRKWTPETLAEYWKEHS